MGKYRVTVVFEAPSAAEAANRITVEDAEFNEYIERITVEPVVPQAFAPGGYVQGSSYGSK